MKDSTYFFWNKVLYYLLWRGRTYGLENIPAGKPAVLVANHLGASGPIGIHFFFPMRVYTWVEGNIFDPELSANQLHIGFGEEVLHLKPPYSTWVEKFFSWIVVPLFAALDLIPVYRKDPVRTLRTYDRSLEHLSGNHLVLIFPEVHELPKDPRTNI
jgi:1-acyl-sn-glycerol-3-phosphate acyltransferase